jgi:hypothetical protein
VLAENRTERCDGLRVAPLGEVRHRFEEERHERSLGPP